MASSDRPARSDDPKTDDPSIIGISRSQPGASGRQNHQKSHPLTHPGAHGARQKQDRQTPQQPARRTQQYQQQRTPNSNEKRRQEHWKVPHGNSHHSPLAKNLFGAENNPSFQFGFQNDSRYGYQMGAHSGYHSRKAQGRTNQPFQRYEGQSSKVRHQQHNAGASQGEKSKNATRKAINSTETLSESERKVQFFETLMKNGEKGENLKITVTDKSSEKKNDGKHPEINARQPAAAAPHQAGSKQTPAIEFINPLMAPRNNEELLDFKTPEEKHQKTADDPSPKKKENAVDSAPITENATEKAKKKKKKRNKEKKKKEDKIEEVKQDNIRNDLKPPSQAPNTSSDKKETKVENNLRDNKSILKKPDTTVQKELKENETKSSKTNQKMTEQDTKEEKTSSVTKQEERNHEELELGLEQAEKRLEKDMIFKLGKKSPTFPEANYFCKLCSHHLNTIAHAHKHIKDKRHKKEWKAKQQDEQLRQLKVPPATALEALDRHLHAVIKEKMLSEDDVVERRKVLKRLDEVVSKELPGCSVVAYGSSVTMIGLKSSDINVDVQYNGGMRTPAVLMALLKILKKADDFTEVQEDFDAKVPRIEITEKTSNLRCSLSMNNVKALHTTRLLKIYGKIEPTVIKLSMLLRLWAHFCQVDKQQDGSLPPHSFTLMAIFYLQQKYGLPVLHEVMADHDIDSVLEETGGHNDVLKSVNGEWWYHPTTPPAEKKDAKKSEDVEEDVDETAEFSESEDDLEITFSESPTKEKTIRLSENHTAKKEKPLVPVKIQKCFADGNACLAQLWLEILKFYTSQFDIENLIITVRMSERVTRSDRGWSHRRIAIEDPCSTKWNLCKPMNSQALFNYFITRLKYSVFYFHTAHHSVRNKLSPKTGSKTDQKPQSPKKSSKKNKIMISEKSIDEYVDSMMRSVYEEVKSNSQRLIDDDDQLNGPESVNHKLHEDSSCMNEGVKGQVLTSPKATGEHQKNDVIDPVSKFADSLADDIISGVNKLDLNEKKNQPTQDLPEINYDSCYKFTKESLMDGKVPVVICSVCKKEGHRKKNCPDEVKIKVYPLPPFSDKLRRMLDVVCRDMYEMYVPKEDEVRMREKVCSDLLDFLQKNYDEKVRMCLFGSSRNRFTFRGSDLDICMTFKGNETGEKLDYAEVIENLAKVLRKDPNLRQIIPITTAKVPIVKFFHPKACLEGDISLYNLLAQRNTSMLALYASIDERCRMLGYAMKAFVKRCCIGDASRGSLSSYAYILMVIYFLQQRDPPVLPVLQELYAGDKMPEHIVDGWNSWFYDGIGSLEKVWAEFGKNQESLGQLWMGMLRFYTELFDFSRHVVSIRQKKLLTAFEKEWTSKCICIEDPFDLNHNLGAGVSRKMTNFILKVFVKARERFGTDPGHISNGVFTYQDYFFNAEFLMDGQEVPNDRCCRICGKIGHFVKDCPKRRQRGKKTGEESKFREIECFACGKKGHFKKDCPEPKQGHHGSPIKDAPFLQHHPLRIQMPLMLPHQPLLIPPLMQNAGQRPPVIVQAKRMDHPNSRFPESQATAGRRHPPQTLQKQENLKRQNPQHKGAAESNSQRKTPQDAHREQNQEPSTPPSSSVIKPPFPSSGPSSNQKTNQSQKAAAKQTAKRNLTTDLEAKKGSGKKSVESPAQPLPSDLTPSKRNVTLKETNEKSNQALLGDSPSPGTVYTVAEVESQMLKESNKKRPKTGENLNHLIPKQNSHEEMHQLRSPGFPAYQGYANSPPFAPYTMPPFTPPTPPMYQSQFHPSHSTSPRNRGIPFHFNPQLPPGYHRNHGDEGLSTTPPSPFTYPHMQIPNDISPPSPGYGFQHPNRGQGHRVMTPDEHITSRTFVNSNKGSRREVRFTAPSSAPPYYSYPPHPGHAYGPPPPHWSGPNPRK